ncbi:hypothetical protein IJM86_06145 [bacterium]|nr:hypothetical protein [bacterium]
MKMIFLNLKEKIPIAIKERENERKKEKNLILLQEPLENKVNLLQL